MSFLDTEEEVNPVLSGYFAKLMTMLLSREEKLIPFLYSNDSIVKLAKHSYNNSLVDLLTNILKIVASKFEEVSLERETEVLE